MINISEYYLIIFAALFYGNHITSYPVGTVDFTEKIIIIPYPIFNSGFFFFNFIPIG